MPIIYTLTDSNCGQRIFQENPGEILEWIKNSIENMDPCCDNKSVFTIECIEMTEEEIEAIPEFDGC